MAVQPTVELGVGQAIQTRRGRKAAKQQSMAMGALEEEKEHIVLKP